MSKIILKYGRDATPQDVQKFLDWAGWEDWDFMLSTHAEVLPLAREYGISTVPVTKYRNYLKKLFEKEAKLALSAPCDF